MAEVILEARHTLIGDSFWLYSAISGFQRNGDSVTVACRPDNAEVFLFIRDYAIDADRTSVRIGCGPSTSNSGGGPNPTDFPKGIMRLRREPQPIVAQGPYICFQPESASHSKRSRAMKDLVVKPGICSYSLGVRGEYVISGSEAFQSRTITEAARLIYNARGMVGIMSSMTLLACMLGKQVVCTGYDGLSLSPDDQPTGHEKPRCIFSVGGVDSLVHDVVRHIGQGFISGT